MIEAEKKELSDKIGEQMAKTLEMAVHDRMQTQKRLTQVETELKLK